MNRDLMVVVVLLLGTSFETLAAPRELEHRLDLEPGSRLTLMLRNARLAKLFQEKEEKEEEEPDYGDYEPADYDLESLGGIEGLQDALKQLTGLARDLDELETRILREMEEMRSATTTTTTTTTTTPRPPPPVSNRRSSLDLGAGLTSLSNLASELDELEDHIDRMRNRNRIMPRNRSSNTLGNVGSLLQDAVDTTEDIALRTDVGKSELSGLTPAMRMAIMKNRIMKSAATRTNSDSGEEESPYSARIDSGLVVTTERETQVSSSADLSSQNVADFLNEILDVVTVIDNTVLTLGEEAIGKKANLLSGLIQLITGTSNGK